MLEASATAITVSVGQARRTLDTPVLRELPAHGVLIDSCCGFICLGS
jgi:hypothetical protein